MKKKEKIEMVRELAELKEIIDWCGNNIDDNDWTIKYDEFNEAQVVYPKIPCAFVIPREISTEFKLRWL